MSGPARLPSENGERRTRWGRLWRWLAIAVYLPHASRSQRTAPTEAGHPRQKPRGFTGLLDMDRPQTILGVRSAQRSFAPTLGASRGLRSVRGVHPCGARTAPPLRGSELRESDSPQARHQSRTHRAQPERNCRTHAAANALLQRTRTVPRQPLHVSASQRQHWTSLPYLCDSTGGRSL